MLEITEAAGVDDLPRTAAVLGSLRARGVRVSLDDFGAGRSSLTLLRNLPLDTVKVDRTLVAASARTTADALLLRLLVDVCHGLGLRVCMEGVEEEEQAVRLTRLGADGAQGWRFGRPVPPGPAGEPVPAVRAEPVRPPPPAADGTGTSEFVVAADPDGGVLFASATVFDVLGLLPSDLVGRPFEDLVHPSDRAAPDAPERTVRVRHADGRSRWVLVRPVPGTTGARPRPGRRRAAALPRRHLRSSRRSSGCARPRRRSASSSTRPPPRWPCPGWTGSSTGSTPPSGRCSGAARRAWSGSRWTRSRGPRTARSTGSTSGSTGRDAPRTRPVRKRYTGADGTPVPVEVQVSLVHAADGRPTGVVAHVRPVGRPAG